MLRPTCIYGPNGSTATRDLFGVQDEITSRIAVALSLEVPVAEAGRTTPDPDALDYILRGRAATMKPPTRERYAVVISLFERALAIPGSAFGIYRSGTCICCNRARTRRST